MPGFSVIADRPIIARAQRHSVAIMAEISGPTVEPFLSLILNLSSSGLLIGEAGRLQVGDVFHLRLPGVPPRYCQIVRLKKGGGAGARFKDTIVANGS